MFIIFSFPTWGKPRTFFGYFAWYAPRLPSSLAARDAKKQMSSWLAVLVRICTKVVRVHNVQSLISIRGCQVSITRSRPRRRRKRPAATVDHPIETGAKVFGPCNVGTPVVRWLINTIKYNIIYIYSCKYHKP